MVGSVTAEGLVEINGQIDGELCTALHARHRQWGACKRYRSRRAGRGRWKRRRSIQAKEVLLKSQAHVVGDIHHQISFRRGVVHSSMVVRCKAAETEKLPEKLEGKKESCRPSGKPLSS